MKDSEADKKYKINIWEEKKGNPINVREGEIKKYDKYERSRRKKKKHKPK